jgi:hypothetical protein
MKNHIIGLTYKDLYAIKHALMWNIETKKNHVDSEEWVIDNLNKNLSEERMNIINQFKQDIEHETRLLERIAERINEIKDKYKIK